MWREERNVGWGKDRPWLVSLPAGCRKGGQGTRPAQKGRSYTLKLSTSLSAGNRCTSVHLSCIRTLSPISPLLYWFYLPNSVAQILQFEPKFCCTHHYLSKVLLLLRLSIPLHTTELLLFQHFSFSIICAVINFAFVCIWLFCLHSNSMSAESFPIAFTALFPVSGRRFHLQWILKENIEWMNKYSQCSLINPHFYFCESIKDCLLFTSNRICRFTQSKFNVYDEFQFPKHNDLHIIFSPYFNVLKSLLINF